ncbi:MAG: S8 family serine peptidase [Desulfurivibrio sp.]|nr:S8 family serine peptidase [Desulfurivibrio sp.]
MGELSTCRDLRHWSPVGGGCSGTSMAAPHVAHLAATLLIEYPDADADLIRALLVAHAAVPEAGSAFVC